MDWNHDRKESDSVPGLTKPRKDWVQDDQTGERQTDAHHCGEERVGTEHLVDDELARAVGVTVQPAPEELVVYGN